MRVLFFLKKKPTKKHEKKNTQIHLKKTPNNQIKTCLKKKFFFCLGERIYSLTLIEIKMQNEKQLRRCSARIIALKKRKLLEDYGGKHKKKTTASAVTLVQQQTATVRLLCSDYFVHSFAKFLEVADLLSLRVCCSDIRSSFFQIIMQRSKWTWNTYSSSMMVSPITQANIRHLIASHCAAKRLDFKTMFPSLTRLYLLLDWQNSRYSKYTITFPDSLTHLRFADFNLPIESSLGNSVSTGFSLPPGLVYLHFGDRFNQPIHAGVLPCSLTSLKFGYSFNQPISLGVLPSALQNLYFGSRFEHPLAAGCLPPSLTKLHLGDFFNESIENLKFPSSLTKLNLSKHYDLPLSNNEISFLPSGLQQLDIGYDFNQLISSKTFPTTLTSLTLCCPFKTMEESILPSSLIQLRISRIFHKNMFKSTPQLQFLIFQTAWNDLGLIPLEPGMLPNSLLALDLGTYCSTPLVPGLFPSRLLTLKMSYHFDQTLKKGIFPNSLTFLDLGASFNHAIEPGILPPFLHALHLPRAFKKPLEPYSLPASLETLRINGQKIKIPDIKKTSYYFTKKVCLKKRKHVKKKN